MKKLSNSDECINSGKIYIDKLFLLNYQDQLTEPEIAMIEQLERVEDLHEKAGNKIRDLRMSIFGKMWASRKKAESMEYKGYSGVVKFDDEAGIFHGEIINLRDVITFQGRTVDELHKAFQDSVDDYLEFCKERGKDPEKPPSGNSTLDSFGGSNA